jgi:pantoate--beta-alanine ligase
VPRPPPPPADAIRAGERDGATLEAVAQSTIRSEPRVRLDYAELVDAHTMHPAARVDGELVLAVAAFVGRARLIDNLTITAIGAEVDTDLGVVAEEQTA